MSFVETRIVQLLGTSFWREVLCLFPRTCWRLRSVGRPLSTRTCQVVTAALGHPRHSLIFTS